MKTRDAVLGSLTAALVLALGLGAGPASAAEQHGGGRPAGHPGPAARPPAARPSTARPAVARPAARPAVDRHDANHGRVEQRVQRRDFDRHDVDRHVVVRHDVDRRDFDHHAWRFERGHGWRFETVPGVWSPFYAWWWVDDSPVMLPVPDTTVVQYPNGYYQLAGDGVTVPYYWVWVPYQLGIAAPPPPPVG